MAYRRGASYFWASSSHMNLWVASTDGAISLMRASGWGHDWAERVGAEHLSGVAIPHKDFDELVVQVYDGMTERQRRRARTRKVARKRLAAMKERQERRKAALADLTRMSEEMGGYDVSAEDIKAIEDA